MGLDTSHNAWHGPYGYFHNWRVFIAKKADIDLTKMEGFSNEDRTIPGQIKFSDLTHDDIHPLLDHSDCDGQISPEDALKISRRLDQILDTMNPNDKWYIETLQFAEGCLQAYEMGQSIEFH